LRLELDANRVNFHGQYRDAQGHTGPVVFAKNVRLKNHRLLTIAIRFVGWLGASSTLFWTTKPVRTFFTMLFRKDTSCTTDHGAVLGRRAALVYGNRDTSTNLRYKFGLNLNADAKQAVILRKPMQFMLPDDGINKNYLLAREDFYFVYPTRFHEFERHFRGSFQHGGISLEEMVLPLLTLEPRRG
jgi:hypothetical protein